MPNIETPEEKMRKVEHPHVFAMRLVSKHFDLCQKVRGAAMCERITIPTAMMDEIAAHDAAIRSEQAELLRVCGEALGAIPKIMEAFKYTPDEDSCTGQSIFKAKLNEDGFFIALNSVKATLATLKEAGVKV